MKIYFKISEFCITPQNIEQSIADAILLYHVLPMSVVREKLGAAITVSKSSGYRPYIYERQKGRSGRSQHTFLDRWEKGQGAADYTAKDLHRLLELMFIHTKYTRICFYPHQGFIHADYKPPTSGKGERAYYIADKNSVWKFQNIIE